jgi:hypothetical protein|tara:strand:+ start:827 stop:1543 length:717 start_codon:yes stop_codon:yes gene_type:complete
MVKNLAIVGLVFMLGACSTMSPYQPLPPVKVITETVEVEIYAPPLPKEISLADVDWKVISNTPCKPATGKKNIGNGKWYYTTDKYQYEDYIKEDGSSARRVVKDAEGNRIQLDQLTDDSGVVIQTCGNLQQKIAEIEILLDGEFVIFAITPDGYERMAANLQEIKRYINQQKEIIYYYREATAPKGVKGWLEENKERQSNQAEEVEIRNNDTEAQSAVPVKEDFKESFSLKKLFNRDE